jgi:uncharacterized alkaline shock family protein YloU
MADETLRMPTGGAAGGSPSRDAPRPEETAGTSLRPSHRRPERDIQDTQSVPLQGRGSTIIADDVLETLAAKNALGVPGVVRHSTGTLGTTFPTADAETAGDRIRLQLRVAVQWEAKAHEVASAVRSEVRRKLQEQTGKTVDRVDVTVEALVPAARRDDETPRRVR